MDGKTSRWTRSLRRRSIPALPEFDVLLPTLLNAYAETVAADPRHRKLAEPMAQLKAWDRRWSAASVPTTLAVFWGEELWQRVAPDARKANLTVYEFMETRASSAQRLDALASVVDKLTADFGTWKLPWGDVNRFQRLTGDIVQPFDDNKPSLAIGFTSSRWGSLASSGARSYNGTKKIYGTTREQLPCRGGVRRPRACQGRFRRRRRAATRPRVTSTIRPCGMRPAICATSTSIPINCRVTSSALTIRESSPKLRGTLLGTGVRLTPGRRAPRRKRQPGNCPAGVSSAPASGRSGRRCFRRQIAEEQFPAAR